MFDFLVVSGSGGSRTRQHFQHYYLVVPDIILSLPVLTRHPHKYRRRLALPDVTRLHRYPHDITLR